jgi:hypothetical protein
MDGTKQMLGWIRRIERKFESSRLEPQCTATAYATVLPVIRKDAAWRSVRQPSSGPGAADGWMPPRAMGA